METMAAPVSSASRMWFARSRACQHWRSVKPKHEFAAHIPIAPGKAKLFADENMRNNSDAILESMSNGVVTVDDEQRIVSCNGAGLRILKVERKDIQNRKVDELFAGNNGWVLRKLRESEEAQAITQIMDAELTVEGAAISVNLTAVPLFSVEKEKIGSMLVFEDISNEKRLKSMISRYMDPSIADILVASDGEVLGSQRVPATVLFADIRGFTSMSEELGAEGSVSLLNEYFSLMVDVILRERGMLDKFMGDAIMAVFGVPEPHTNDADRAVQAAVAMMRELNGWNQERARRGKPPVRIGVGLNTGAVVAGNIGSRKRMDFTVIGDGVNLASRLESACKTYGAEILISESTYKAIKRTYKTRELDAVVVKGKSQPVAVYEVMDHHTDDTYPGLTDALQRFGEGLAQYRKQNFQEAFAAFQDVLAINGHDKAAQLYIERCKYLKHTPPPRNWNGVWPMQ